MRRIMTVLITGAGLIGSQIARLLAEGGERPVLFDLAPQPEALAEIVPLDRLVLARGDLLDPLSLARVIQEHGITRIIHTAANPLLTVGAQRDPYAAIRVNVVGTVHVLEAARIFGVGRVVVTSSAVLSHYLTGGEDGGDPAREEAFPRPATFYAATKQAVESLALNYHRWLGVDVVIVRFAAAVGPWCGRGGGGPGLSRRGDRGDGQTRHPRGAGQAGGGDRRGLPVSRGGPPAGPEPCPVRARVQAPL
jgi:nucleoside-diphosphate-sugar epimerase